MVVDRSLAGDLYGFNDGGAALSGGRFVLSGFDLGLSDFGRCVSSGCEAGWGNSSVFR